MHWHDLVLQVCSFSCTDASDCGFRLFLYLSFLTQLCSSFLKQLMLLGSSWKPMESLGTLP